jgi:hypothetical protein
MRFLHADCVDSEENVYELCKKKTKTKNINPNTIEGVKRSMAFDGKRCDSLDPIPSGVITCED